MYELTTGQVPFEAEDPFAIITQHLHAPPVPPKAHQEDLPGYLNSLILNLLEKDPDKTFGERGRWCSELLENPARQQKHRLVVSKELSGLDRIVRGRIVGRRGEYEKARILWKDALPHSQGQTLAHLGRTWDWQVPADA